MEKEIQIKNFYRTELEDLDKCHDGIGVLKHKGLFSGEEFQSGIQFMNYTVLPPGTTIGDHKHENDEEIYVVLDGKGIMHLDGESFEVTGGAVIKNKPYGIHGIVNTGDSDLKLLVFEVKVQ